MLVDAFIPFFLLTSTTALVPDGRPSVSCTEHHGDNTRACLDDSRCAVSNVPGEDMCIELTPKSLEDNCIFSNRTEVPTCSILMNNSNELSFRNRESLNFSEESCKHFVHLAGAAYCDAGEIESWTCKQCVAEFSVKVMMNNEVKRLLGFIGIDSDGSVIISFRGTINKIQDWLDDLDVIFTKPYDDLPNVKVHKGFYDSYQWFKPHILQYLKATKPSKLIITGHSLGGSIATLCAFDLAHIEGYEVSEVWTFGEPRDGNSDFALEYGKTISKHWRVTHHHDIVPHVPLEAEGYYHVAREVYFPDEDYVPGHFKICDGSGEDKTCSDGNFLDLSVFDHNHYLNITLGPDGCK